MFLWNLSSGFLLISRAMWVLHIHYQHRHYLAHSLRFTHTNYLPHIAHESTPFYTQNHTSHVAQAWHWRGDTAASVWSQMLPRWLLWSCCCRATGGALQRNGEQRNTEIIERVKTGKQIAGRMYCTGRDAVEIKELKQCSRRKKKVMTGGTDWPELFLDCAPAKAMISGYCLHHHHHCSVEAQDKRFYSGHNHGSSYVS